MSSVEKMESDVIVFDIAPTCQKLRFVNFLKIEEGLDKFLFLKQNFSTLLCTVKEYFDSREEMQGRLEKIVTKIIE